MFSCKPLGNCKEYAKACKDDECLLIVEKKPEIRDNRFDYKGINPFTKKNVIVTLIQVMCGGRPTRSISK